MSTKPTKEVLTIDTGVQPVRRFEVEAWFAKYEFTCRHMLSCSDAETISLKELLSHADEESKELWDNLALGYSETLGHPVLLDAVRDKYNKYHGDESAVFPQNDGLQMSLCAPCEGIYCTMQGLLNPGDVVVAMMPAYQVLYEVAKAKGCTVVPWAAKCVVNDETGAIAWHFVVQDLCLILGELHESGKGSPRMVVVNTPHNPTGFAFGQEQLDEIHALLDSNETTLFCDEMYADILLRKKHNGRIPSVIGKKNSILLSGLSKPAGLPGLRMGWVIFDRAADFKAFENMRNYTTICHSNPSEVLSLIAVRNFTKLVARSRALAKENMSLLQEKLSTSLFSRFFGKIEHYPCSGTENSHDFVAMTVFVPLSSAMDADRFTTFLAESCGLALLPGTAFEESLVLQNNQQCVRIGLARKGFPAALEALQSVLEKRSVEIFEHCCR